MDSTNPIHSDTNQQQSTWYVVLRLTFDTSQVVSRYQLTMHDGVHIILQQLHDSDTELIPLSDDRLNETWAQREYEPIHEPHTQPIPRGTWRNQSSTQRDHQIPEHVQNQVDEFFRLLPPSTSPTPYPVFWTQNILVPRSASNNSRPVRANRTMQMLSPVPINVPNQRTRRSRTYESQIQRGAATASPSINANANANANADAHEEIDLELRLGRSR
ncbi:hypothetical protein V8G54_004949 [Vigna mungo]|uniref:Uncharacterized protein n=1 Tax=Vigna mungo TaxID=3915 RepID=A0AAQ3PJ72_VIGMU